MPRNGQELLRTSSTVSSSGATSKEAREESLLPDRPPGRGVRLPAEVRGSHAQRLGGGEKVLIARGEHQVGIANQLG